MTNKKRKRQGKNDSSNKIQKPASNGKPSSFLEKMRARLSGGHFRMINEKLYTCTGKEALDYFREDSSLFNLYHAGYKTQMSNWPEQPVNVIIKWLKKQSPSFVVADFGCGEALIAKSVKNTVFSLDLVSNDPDVIACDMANTPLGSASADVAVFCLSLMGTNYQTYLEEACRVLKSGGWLLIAEVKSRFDPNTGGADPEKFSNAISELGFNSVKRASPCIRFNKEGILLAVSTSDNGVKILANAEGIRLLRTVENRAFDASRAASSATYYWRFSFYQCCCWNKPC